jgi:hypothetical protein
MEAELFHIDRRMDEHHKSVFKISEYHPAMQVF